MTQRTALALGLLLSALGLAACSGPEGRLARYMERSEKYFAEQNYDKARIEISNALQIEPNSAPARVLAARVAEKQGKPRDAVGNYQAAIEADPENIEARAALGRLYLLGGLPDKAEEMIGPALEKAPGDSRLLTVRGGLRAMDGDAAGALADAEAALKAAPGDEVALALLASLYRQAGRIPEAISALQGGVELHPDSVELRIILGEMYHVAGNQAEAEKQLEIIADRNRTTLGHWQNLARFRLLQKNPAGAEQALRDAVKHNPDSIEAKSLLVTLIANQKGVEAAQAQMLEFVKAEPKRAELRIALGQFHEATGKAQEAEAAYREVIAAQGVDPLGLQARNRLAALQVKNSDLSGAELLIKEVLAENPRDNDALVLRAGIALSRNETAAAIADLRAVLRDQPTSQPLMRALSRAHMMDSDAALAEEVLRNAVQVNPADVDSRFDLAALLAQTGRPKLAQPILEQLARDAAQSVEVREALFRAQTAQQDWKGAEQTAEEVKRLRPDLPVGYMLGGSLLELQKKYPEAIAQYEQALRTTNEPLPVLRALVRAEFGRKEPAKAIARLHSFLEKSPGEPAAHQMLGEVQMAQRDMAGALASFDRVIALNPKWWLPYRSKALVHEAAGKPELAVEALRQGYEASGSSDIGVELAVTQDRQGQHEEAIRVYEDLHKRLPASLPVANNLAMMLVTRRADAGSFSQAEKLGEMLATSNNAAYLDTRGWIKFRLGKFDEALPLLHRAADSSPKSQEILYHLGMAQYRSGDRNAARQNLEAALAANQAFIGVEEVRATLQVLRGAG